MYPATGRPVAVFKEELSPYKLSKGTIRFPLSQPVPLKLIARIAKFRAKEVGGQGKVKTTHPLPKRKTVAVKRTKGGKGASNLYLFATVSHRRDQLLY